MTALWSLCRIWLLPAAGLGALSALIWYVGPLIAVAGHTPLDSALVRVIVIALTIIAWLGYRLYRALSRRRDEARLSRALTRTETGTGDESARAELERLRKRLQEALAVLRKTRVPGQSGRASLDRLPWYIIIGPPGAGKTTLLANSGLNFPLARQFGREALRGVGGTRDCDWWFTDEAILLDTAGRYTTQDSDAEHDRRAWLGFLDLLKSHRRRRPVNGALVVLGVDELLTGDPARIEDHARAVRARLAELEQHLRLRFPVYLLITKLDLLAGFMEFFDDLGRSEREQVWGVTFALAESPDAALDGLAEEIGALEERLEERLVERLTQERDPRRRNLLYTFPRQFGLLRDQLGVLCEAIFRTNVYENPALLRGIYFSSATQEGTPIDRLLGTLAANLGLDRRRLAGLSGSGRSYFLTRLLREVVFPEAGLAGADLAYERRRRWLRRAAVAALAVVTVGLTVAWAVSWHNNRSYVEAYDARVQLLRQQIEALAPTSADDASLGAVLDELRTLPHGYAQSRDPGAGSGLGLFQGRTLGPEAEQVYRRLLRTTLIPRIVQDMEHRLRSVAVSSDLLFDTLRAYLMLDSAEHYDADAVLQWLRTHWQDGPTAGTPGDRWTRFQPHLAILLEQRPRPLPQALDPVLIQQTRAELLATPLATRVYDLLKRRAADLPPFRLAEAAGREAALVLTRRTARPLDEPVPGLYTARGYREVVLPARADLGAMLTSERWVLGDQSAVAAADADMLMEQVRHLYLRDYLRLWDGLALDLDIVPLTSPNQALEVLGVLTARNSPLQRALEAIARETNLEAVAQAAAADGAADGADIAAAPDPVTQRFAPLRAQLSTESGAAPVEHLLQLLNELYGRLGTLAGATGESLVQSAAAQVQATATQLRLEALRAPPPLREMLTAVAQSGTRLVAGGIREQLNSAWRAEVLNFYSTALEGRYPLSRQSPRDAALEDFGQFFAPDGRLDRFFRLYLADYVDSSSRPWRWHPNAAARLGVADTLLEPFQRAELIREAFFRPGSPDPAVRFELTPLYIDPSVGLLQITLGEQVLDFAPARSVPGNLQWPSPGGATYVRVQIEPPLAGLQGQVGMDGPWALFRLLDRVAQLEPTSARERYLVHFNLDGRRASFELRAASAINPFRLRELGQFHLPAQF